MERDPSIAEKYLNEYIEKRARFSADRAAATDDISDAVIEEAVFFDDLIHFPDPFASHDYDYEWKNKDE